MIQVLKLIQKDFLVDWRQQHPLSGILLYLASTIFAAYMAFSGFLPFETWNILFWIILLFTSINAISKSFIQEDRRSMYYFFLAKPSAIITGKLLYSFAYQLALSFLAILLYIILFSNPIENYGFFILNLLFGCLGLSSAFTMVSAIAFKTSNRSIMMAVLGFPIIIPVLILAINNAGKILEGYVWIQIQGNMLTLLSVDVIIIVLTFVLFPFTWRS